ncbi:Chondramide synthase cmdD [subsurface metagenome]
MAKVRKLLKPSEVPPIPGAEDWREMYPHYLTFDSGENKELAKWEGEQFWYYNNFHFPRVLRPLDEVFCGGDQLWFGVSASRVVVLPDCMGVPYRLLNGYSYNTSVLVTDPKVIEERHKVFAKRWQYFLDNWAKLVPKWEKNVRATIKELEQIHFPDLPEIDYEERVFNLDANTAYDVLAANHNLWRLLDRVWAHHYELYHIPYGQFLELREFGKKHGFEEACMNLVKGLKPMVLEPEERLRDLAKLAVKLGVQGAFKNREGNEVLTELEKTDKGKEWIEKFDEFKYPYFLAPESIGLYVDDKSWIDDLVTLFCNIRNFVEQLDSGQSIDRDVEGLLKERDELTEKCRNMIKTDEDGEEFDKLLGETRKVAHFSEDHNFFIEFWGLVLVKRKVIELGEWLFRHKAIDEPTDVWFFMRHELDDVVFDVCQAWGLGVEVDSAYWKKRVEKRKKMWEKLCEYTPSPVLGEFPEEEFSDPSTVMLWGITEERLEKWKKAVEEEGDTLTGVGLSDGVVEGHAVVVPRFQDSYKLKRGDILVTSVTAPAWGPVLVRSKAVAAY